MPHCNTLSAQLCRLRFAQHGFGGGDERLFGAAFAARFAQLRRVVAALSADDSTRRVLRFDPPVPTACMVHVYLRGSEAVLAAARAKVKAATGATLWNRLRGKGHGKLHDELYFELSMGPTNAAIPLEAVLEAFRAFARVRGGDGDPCTFS